MAKINHAEIEQRIAELETQIDAWEAEHRPISYPPGTPHRRRLNQEAEAECLARRRRDGHQIDPQCRERNALLATLRRSRVARAASAARRTPEQAKKRWATKWLRKLGFARECTTESGSSYYERFIGNRWVRIRVADHNVPWTQERAEAAWSWATHGRQIDVTQSYMEIARKLVEIRQQVRDAG